MKNDIYVVENILDVVAAFNSEKDYFDLLNVILDKMMGMANADAGTLYVLEDDQLHFRILKNITLNTFQGAKDEISLPPIVLDEKNIENISAYTAVKNEMVSVTDVYTDETFNFSGPKNYDKITGYRTCSMLVFPLSTTEDEVVGVIQLINALDRETGEITSFENTCDSTILLALANISANALTNIMYAKEIDELFNSFVRVMTKAIDERSVYNVNHTNNVARYCWHFAEYLSGLFDQEHEFYFSGNRRDQLVMAAYLHDIGKIITPLSVMDKADRLGPRLEIIKLKFEIKRQQLANDALSSKISGEEYEKLSADLHSALALIEEVNTAGFLPDEKFERLKELAALTYTETTGNVEPLLSEADMVSLSVRRGTLTDEERQIMQEHASITGRLLDSMKFNKSYKDVAGWARCHHEALDGTGYPLGLRGDELTPEMCILSIIDIFDALTAKDRPYKQAMPLEKALGILSSMAADGKLHPELLRHFCESKVWER